MKTQGEKLDPLDVHIGGRLRALREQEHVTQAQIAKAIGVTFQQVQKYEKGLNRISAARLGRAAQALGCEIAASYPHSDAEGTSEEERTSELVALFIRMGRRQRDALLGTARAMAPWRGRGGEES